MRARVRHGLAKGGPPGVAKDPKPSKPSGGKSGGKGGK